MGEEEEAALWWLAGFSIKVCVNDKMMLPVAILSRDDHTKHFGFLPSNIFL